MQTYLVGGAVRDRLLNYPVYERDWVVIGATPEDMIAKGYEPVGKDFPVFLHPETKEEYALARTERKTSPGYTGFEFYTAPEITLEQDLLRRDLTINAIAMDEQGNIVDPYGGQLDIESKCLRHVSDAFKEDPVRILRIARFAARYSHLGFTIAKETLALMHSMVEHGEVDALVAERVWKETSRALMERSPDTFIHVLNQCGALEKIMPELRNYIQPNSGNESQAILGLRLAAKEQKPLAIRLAVLLSMSNREEIQSLCDRIAIPKYEKDLSILVHLYLEHYLRVTVLEAEQVVKLLENIDAFRRQERFNDFLHTCELISTLNEKATNAADKSARLKSALTICLSINPRDLMAEGFAGKELGEAIHQKRIQRISEYLHENKSIKP